MYWASGVSEADGRAPFFQAYPWWNRSSISLMSSFAPIFRISHDVGVHWEGVHDEECWIVRSSYRILRSESDVLGKGWAMFERG